MNSVYDILGKQELSGSDIVRLLSVSDKSSHDSILEHAYSVKVNALGKKVYLRGLIEFSNRCIKNCLYCGIRSGNTKIDRYTLTDDEILNVVETARLMHLNGVVLQSGEIKSRDFTRRITELVKKIKKSAGTEFRITLSVGEQSLETYQNWFDAGADRYLLRIETSNRELYKKIHPDDKLHDYETRVECLEKIRSAGFQTGTGVMIGLPFQTFENLADDLLFIKQMDIDMVGMGPYIEHSDTPLYKNKDMLMNLNERFDLSLRMIAVLRIMMPDINIASTTALQSINPFGRELGLKAGANVLMPNITPVKYRSSYMLYENKPCMTEEVDECLECMEKRVEMVGEEILYGDFGDSRHFINRKTTKQ